jgi:hypothetical protein
VGFSRKTLGTDLGGLHREGVNRGDAIALMAWSASRWLTIL